MDNALFAGLRKNLSLNIRAFLSEEISSSTYSLLRILLSLALLIQAVTLFSDLHNLFGPNGLVQWDVYKKSRSWELVIPPSFGTNESGLSILFAFYVASLLSLFLGIYSRVSAVAAWLSHSFLADCGPASVYGVDMFSQIGLFYLIWADSGSTWSYDRAVRKKFRYSASPLPLRVFQIHICIGYFAAGIEKALGSQWWNGEAIWRAVMRPDMQQFDLSWISSYPFAVTLIGIATVATETLYPILIWIPKARYFSLFSIISLHLGIGVVMGLHSFSFLMIVTNVCLFGLNSTKKSVRRVPLEQHQGHYAKIC